MLTVSPASAAADPCVVTITPMVTDDSVTLGEMLDDSLAAAGLATCQGVAVSLGSTATQFEYQLPRSLNWAGDIPLSIVGVGDDTPVLFAADDTRLLTIVDDEVDPPLTVNLDRLSMRGGHAEHGGAIRGFGFPIITLTNMEFADNTVDVGGSGGAVEARAGKVIAVTSRFERNVASDQGGALAASDLDIRGSEFVDNRSDYAGGAITNWDRGGILGTMEVGPEAGRPTVFIGNAAQLGGAIQIGGTPGTPHIQANFVRNSGYPFDPNWGAQGGAIYTWGTTLVEVSNSTFVDDSASYSDGAGGAIWSDAPLKVVDSSFTGVTADVNGGAIVATSGALIEAAYFAGSSARRGGAVYLSGTNESSITDSTFWGNSADDSGGSVYLDSAVTLSVTASTFDDSTMTSTSTIAAAGSATVSLAGSILSKDASSAPPCEGSVDDSGGNLVTAACGPITGSNLATGASAVVSDDSLGLLAPALNQTYPNNTGTTPTIGLEPSSVAINRYTAFCPSDDQRGIPRPQGALCDAGAYEAGPIQTIVPLHATSGAIGTSYSESLSATGFGFNTFQWDDSGTTLPPGLTLDATGLISGTPTAAGTYTFTARVVGPVDDSSITQTITVEGAPTPPNPPPSTLASPPREVRATAGLESAAVAWLPPTSTGSFPVTSYQAVASPGGGTCMVAAPTLTCTITGLKPGTPYTVTARALTGAGWSEASTPSAVVVPLGPEVPTILITNSRDRAQKSMARVEGTTTGLVGAEVVPYLRVAGQTAFTPGTSTRTVDAEGNFVWQRKSKKRFTVYFTSGDVTSNRLVIRPE